MHHRLVVTALLVASLNACTGGIDYFTKASRIDGANPAISREEKKWPPIPDMDHVMTCLYGLTIPVPPKQEARAAEMASSANPWDQLKFEDTYGVVCVPARPKTNDPALFALQLAENDAKAKVDAATAARAKSDAAAKASDAADKKAQDTKKAAIEAKAAAETAATLASAPGVPAGDPRKLDAAAKRILAEEANVAAANAERQAKEKRDTAAQLADASATATKAAAAALNKAHPYAKARKEARNRLIGGLLTQSDRLCSDYLTNLTLVDRETNFILSSLTTGLGGLGAIFTPANTARALAGGAAFFGGLRGDFNDTTFLKLAHNLIYKTISAERKAAHDNMVKSLKLDYDEYDYGAAFADVEAYHNKCSLVSAFANLHDRAVTVSEADRLGRRTAEISAACKLWYGMRPDRVDAEMRAARIAGADIPEKPDAKRKQQFVDDTCGS